ncbi:MAG: sulfotransferase [Chthoniobacterales bacterium]|jgi:hypothetical protein
MLVYIASLPHSGSTLLSLLLAKHPRVIALGEVRLQLAKIRRDADQAGRGTCGCGLLIRDCPLWGRFIERSSGWSRPAQDLESVVSIMTELRGPDVVMVDASKIREPIEELAASRAFPVRVFHLSRDYRSWIVSAVDLRRRKGKRIRPGWWLGFEFARRWVRENRKLERSIAASGFPSMRLGYEELVLAPEKAWPAVWNFLGLPDTGVPRNVSGSCNHIFSGNRMREDNERRGVSYDGRWFTRGEWRACSVVLPRMASLNRRWVYSRGLAGHGHQGELQRMAASHGFEP